MSRWPDFIIIGGMKCASSTLHEQLALQPGIVMSDPKEPNYFSDDDQYARGAGWYQQLFESAGPAELAGESSTHYTKRPTHPESVARMRADLPGPVKLIYIMRHPVDRLSSHYIHEWTQGVTADPIDLAVERMPELVDYGRYAMQLEPFLDAFGAESILPVFFDRLTGHRQEQLERVCRFIGYPGSPTWNASLAPQNVSRQRERKSRLRDTLKAIPGLRPLARAVLPERAREGIRDRLWRMRARPVLGDQQRQRVEGIFDADLARLGDWLGGEISCANFKAATDRSEWTWRLSTAVSS